MVDFNDPAYGWQIDPSQMAGALGGQPQPQQQQQQQRYPWIGNYAGAGPAQPQAPPAPRPGPLSGIMDPAVMLPIAAAIAGSPNAQQSLAAGLGGVGAAIPNIRKRAALNAWLKAKSSGDPAALQQATQLLSQADPAFAESMVAAQVTPHRQFTQIGQSIMGQPQYGFVDPVMGTVEPTSGGQQDMPGSGGGAGGAGGAVPGAPSANGTIYDTLPKAQQAQVDQIIQGRMAYPSGFQLAKSPYWNTITAAAEERAQALGVTLDANKYPTRLATQKDFTSGKSAQTITAGNAAIGHLGQLDNAVDKLGNWNGVPFVNYAYNAAANAVANASGQAGNLQTFNAIKSKYSQEITKFYRASGGSDSDISEAMGQLDSARSPAELHATIKAQVGLLNSKIGAMQEQWHNGMGADQPDFPLIAPESKKVLDRIAPPEAPAQSGGGGGALPVIADPAIAMKLPPGTQFKTPDGRIKIVPGAAPGQ